MRPILYRRIARFNIIVIAIIGVVGLLGIAAVVVLFVAQGLARSDRFAAAPLGPETAGENRLVLGNGTAVDGTTLRIFTLGRAGDASPYGSSGYSEGDDRNVLVVDERDGSSRTILPDNRRRITQWEILGPRDESMAGSKTEARIYVLAVRSPAASDTSASRRSDILVGNFRTGQQQWVVRGIRALKHASLRDDNILVLLTVEDTGLVFRRIDLATLAPRLMRVVAVDAVIPE